MNRVICPACGEGIDLSHAVYQDGWMIDPAGRVAFKGPIHFVPSTWTIILAALAEAKRTVQPYALIDLTGSTADLGCLRAQLSKLRRWLREHGMPNPIQTVRGVYGSSTPGGYRWRNPVSVNAHEAIHA
jgi:hypothetical protein